MANRYCTAADFDGAFDGHLRLRSFLDTATPPAYSSTVFDRAIELATQMVRSYAVTSGYKGGLPDTTDPDTDGVEDDLRIATVGILGMLAYGRQHTTPPDHVLTMIETMTSGIRNGDFPLDLPTTDATAVGGILSTDTSSSGSPSIFGDLGDSL
ncbi:MAG: hypothetical protein GY944_29585 [bacterium]|nr:hypothetical protein [bacterium]